ncbi:hypothetical protein [Ramlibacter sp.]|uniref:hypothetical protein n=1 Tax=Ramlibacter sp. TaxID=1917967 RepID=UPI00183D9BB1|nr:hypothetical protein [Ramlibacter sp.]MBA2676623.1 hypothetical protein [Ramlibacter sp.]
MNHRTTTLAVLLLAALGAGTASAQTVYRCGNSYSQKPCPGGAAVDAADPRSAAQAADTTAAAQRNARAAETLEKERLAQEKRAAPPVIVPRPQATAGSPQADPPNIIKGKKPKHGRSKHATAPTHKDHGAGDAKKHSAKKKSG